MNNDIEYTWKITKMHVQDISENKKNTVVQTYWQKIGTDKNNNFGTFDGATSFTVDPNDDSLPFIPYEELTEKIVLEWIKSSIQSNSLSPISVAIESSFETFIDEQIQKEIDKKKNIPPVSFSWTEVEKVSY